MSNKNIYNYLIWQNPIAQSYFKDATDENIKKYCILPNLFKENQRKDKNNVQF